MGSNSTSRDRYNSISGDSMVFCIRPHWGSLLSHEGSSFSTFSRVLLYPILSDSDDEISTPPHSIQQMSLLEALTVAAIPVVIVVPHIPAVGIELLINTLRLRTRIRSTSYCSSTWWVDEVTTQIRGDQKRLQSLGTDKGIWNRGYLLTYLSSCSSDFGRNTWA